MVALRIRYNERNEFLLTTTPPSNEMLQAGTAEVDFPEIVSGAGWTTQMRHYPGTASYEESLRALGITDLTGRTFAGEYLVTFLAKPSGVRPATKCRT